jgi:hypothetical protein
MSKRKKQWISRHRTEAGHEPLEAIGLELPLGPPPRPAERPGTHDELESPFPEPLRRPPAPVDGDKNPGPDGGAGARVIVIDLV